MLIDSHRADRVAEMCNFGSVSMIDYLERTGVFVPTKKRQKRRGKPREYCFRDVLVLKIISSLLSNGATVSNLKGALQKLQAISWTADEATLEDSLGPLRHLVVSAGNIYLSRSKEELIELASGGQLAFSFLLDLDTLHAELANAWRVQGSLSA